MQVCKDIKLGEYLQQCVATLVSDVVRGAEDSAGDKIVDYCRRFQKRHGYWPSGKEWSKDRSYSAMARDDRNKVLEQLFMDGALVRVSLKTEAGRAKKVFVVPEGEWGSHEGSHGKTFNEAEFYGRA